jgi:hypothetical protein
MQGPPATLVAFFAILIGYPLLQIVCLVASRPRMRRAIAFGEGIKARAARPWEADAVDIALSGSHGLPGYALLPLALPWALAGRLLGRRATGTGPGTSDFGRLRDQVIVVSLMRWPLTAAVAALLSLPFLGLLCIVEGPTAARRACVGEIVRLTGSLRLPCMAERAWVAFSR